MAKLSRDPETVSQYAGASLVAVVVVVVVFQNDARSIEKHSKEARSRYVSDTDGKRSFFARKAMAERSAEDENFGKITQGTS